ncbi:MAG TPA: zinc-dependent metalloprotease, partial [Gemmataceae bacterium]|nr:zinc-dependent metalloprotease [Gemmataceae bacterium]
HNFKGSTMLPNNQLHDTKITRAKGLVGSVMDYNPVNLAPKGVKQGDYFTTTIGPYDYWAIEYAYKPLSGGTEGEAGELQKIANKGARPGHEFGSDEDIFLTADPLTNPFDLGSDVMKFAEDRMLLAEELMQGLSSRVVDSGEGYQRARVAFSILLSQYGNGAYLIARYIGGEHAHRDHRGDPGGRDPLVPVAAAKQREGLKFLQEHIFSDQPFQFPPELLRKLAVERWHHWGTQPGSTDFPLHDRILGIQQVALNELLSSGVLRRIQNNAMKAEKNEQPLVLAEVFRSVSDGIWCDLPNGAAKEEKKTVPNGAAKEEKRTVTSSIMRRNLQREHVKKLSSLVLGQRTGSSGGFAILFGSSNSSATPPDARSLARMHLREIDKRIVSTLTDKQAALDDTARAHLEECHERIGKVLNASMQVND